jgi:ribosomal protein S18 acetylase RimI-like enzyme
VQIGALVSTARDATGQLLDAVLTSEPAAFASSALVFAPIDAIGLEAVLFERGFDVDRYAYLVRRLTDDDAAGAIERTWDNADAGPLTRLLQRAYPGPAGARPFARAGDAAAWAEYVQQLLSTSACGLPLPAASPVVSIDPGRRRLDGVVLTTIIGARAVHLAQVAIDPDARRVGLGRRLVGAALASARRLGFEQATLLVSERNDAALRLYRGLGFARAATFLSAACDQPRRLTSVALATGGASTLR